MNEKYYCKWCKGELELKSWTQSKEGVLVAVGTYEYYDCSRCGYRYLVKEVKS